MNIGFTGTREGMTFNQKRTLSSILAWYASNQNAEQFHHGNCVGSDEQAARIADGKSYVTVAHPAKGMVEWQSNYKSDLSMPEDKPLQRNKTIVQRSDLLIACPKEGYEPPAARGQGTWSCIRYARAKKLKVIIIWPSGKAQ